VNVPILSIDFETASTVDLRRAGAQTYAEDPTTRVLCMAWAFDDEPVSVWREGDPFPPKVLAHISAGGLVRAWNAAFELAIWNNCLWRQLCVADPFHELKIVQVRDTMAQAAYYGLPLSLDMAGPAAGLAISKSKTGHALMLRMCRPRSVDPLSGVATWWHQTDPQKFDELCDYCGQDVEVERAIAAVLPPLPPAELAVWQLDQTMNLRGVGVDYLFVAQMKTLALAAAADVNFEVSTLTAGLVPTVTSTAKLLGYLHNVGYPHADLQKGTVAARLDDAGCAGAERELLELRAGGAKTSAAKLDAMLGASVVRGKVGRVRGMLQYYGASRTGRWAGRLIQLQNMPRGELADQDTVDRAVTAVAQDASPATLRLLFGASPLAVVSTLLRSCIVAAPGHKLVAADFAQIEARVLPWLAGAHGILDLFRRGGDIYKDAAAGIFGCRSADVTKAQRQIGKVAVLALGFAGGKGAFQTMAQNYGLKVSDTEAENIKLAWREANPQTVALWADLDKAARGAIGAGPGPVFRAGEHLRLSMWGPHLVMILPSNRALFYREARVIADPDRPGGSVVTYVGTNQYTRKWERLRTYGGKLAENATQAVARDVMAAAMLEVVAQGVRAGLILTVHDELLAEAEDLQAQGALDHILKIMRTPPPWAHDLPVDAEAWAGQRYRK
jgi:DNA polymerase bacteriophage-type